MPKLLCCFNGQGQNRTADTRIFSPDVGSVYTLLPGNLGAKPGALGAFAQVRSLSQSLSLVYVIVLGVCG